MVDPKAVKVDPYDAAMEKFINILKGDEIPVYRPGEVEYERSVQTSNLIYRYSRPHCVVQPRYTSHVQTIVKAASKSTPRLDITIKNGGHSYAGFSTADRGISLDLSKMNTATLSDKEDPKFITLQGGCLWGHAYKQLVNNKLVGYAVNGGRCPTVGVCGFILGGGLGPFSRSLGMGCDSLLEATVVTADGELVTVNRNDKPDSDKGKLFWALCGGGGGNFGVVVELKLRVHELESEKVTAAIFLWYPGDEALGSFQKTMNKFYTTQWPERTTIDSSWRQTGSTKEDGKFNARLLVYHDGEDKDFDKLIDKKIIDEDMKKQLKRRTLEEDSTKFFHETLVEQWSEDTTKAFSKSKIFELHTSFVFRNDKATIEAVTTIIDAKMKAFKRKFLGEEVLMQFTMIHGGGQMQKRKSDETAFPWREATYFGYVMLQYEQKFLGKSMTKFLGKVRELLEDYSLEKDATYINFPNADFTPGMYEKGYFGANYPKLQEVKDRWDKANFFNFSQGVKPTGWIAPPIEVYEQPEDRANEQFGQFNTTRIEGTSYLGLDGTEAVGGLSGAPRPGGLCDLGF